MCYKVVLGILALGGAAVASQLSFPTGFKFGAASSAYQVEGAWNVSDKGESIWDRIVHTRPEFVSDSSNGDVATDSYHLWEEDLKIIEELGLDFYRFSISWSRLLPNGFANKISEDGRRYYSQMIDSLLERGVEPVVTLYHWDLPQKLQDLGGWTNPLIADWFADYARVAYSLFGDRVKTWITINEPICICDLGYRGKLAPAIEADNVIGVLLCSKYVILAHAKAYRVYEQEFKPMYGGQLSFAQEEFWLEPESEQDLEITLLARDYGNHRYTHPVYSTEGGWPPALEKFMAEKSEKEGYPRSMLPAFTREEIELVRGTYDYFALNHYTSRTVRAARPGDQLGAYYFESIQDIGAVHDGRPEWEIHAGWLMSNPEGLRNCLKLIKQQYGDVRVLITESGLPTGDGGLADPGRIRYYREYLEQVLLAIYEDGVSMMGYTAWSLMDNFEWENGYEWLFGLYAVDFSDPLRPRTAKASARYYASVIRERSLDIVNDV